MQSTDDKVIAKIKKSQEGFDILHRGFFDFWHV